MFLNGRVMNRPEVMIPQAQNKFDADGKLNDQATREFIAAHLGSIQGVGAAVEVAVSADGFG